MEAKTLALYLGCDVKYGEYTGKLIRVDCESGLAVFRIGDGIGQTISKLCNDVMLILRPLYTISYDEKFDLSKIALEKSQGFDVKVIHDCLQVEAWGDGERVFIENYTPRMFQYLLSKAFDLFGLIEKGEAIDSN